MIRPDECCILNSGGGAWAFGTLARQLSAALWLDVSENPRRYNYLLVCDNLDPRAAGEFFIPLRGMELAADKRLLANLFAAHHVPTPETYLVPTLEAAEQLRRENPERDWCLKYPTSSGASGHRMLTHGMTLPREWPRPLIVQEFVRLERPEVYRLYAAGGEVFGWVARRFPAGALSSPWVAHARGARYELAGTAPAPAVAAGRATLEATGLIDSFGCADLVQRPSGEWLVLEVGTDGMYNHVDRDLGCPELEREIERRVAEAPRSRVSSRFRPPGPGTANPQRTPLIQSPSQLPSTKCVGAPASANRRTVVTDSMSPQCRINLTWWSASKARAARTSAVRSWVSLMMPIFMARVSRLPSPAARCLYAIQESAFLHGHGLRGCSSRCPIG